MTQIWVHAPTRDREVVFRREPDFGERTVVRGALLIGKDEEGFLGLAWDIGEGKLLLDLNRNLDLTDDSLGVFDCSQRADEGRYSRQIFSGVRFGSTMGQVTIVYEGDMHVYSYAPGHRLSPFGYLVVHSGWQGEIDLNGKKWRLTIGDNLDGTIGYRDPFALNRIDEGGAGPSVLQLRFVPRNLFWEGQDYELTFAFEPGEDGATLAVTVAESGASLGEVKIEGQFVKRLIFERWPIEERGIKEGAVVVLEEPGPTVSIPANEYQYQKVILAGKDPSLSYRSYEERRVIMEGSPTTLKVGGPLKNKVNLSRKGRTLDLDYKLVGIGGENYEVIRSGGGGPEVSDAYYEWGLARQKMVVWSSTTDIRNLIAL